MIDKRSAMRLQRDLRFLRRTWIEWGQWQEPALPDAIGFMVTEAAETMEAWLRTKAGYTRNNPRPGVLHDIAIEAFDTMLMACVVLDALGESLEAIAEEKLWEMNEKRRVRRNENGH